MIEIVSRARARHWPRKGSGKLALAGAAAALVIAAALLITQQVLPQNLLRQQIVAQIQRSTGFSVQINGPARLRFFLQPRIIIQSLRVADRSGAIDLEAPEVVGYLRLLPLLVGRFEIGHAVLYRPKLKVDFGRAPVSEGGVVQQALRASSTDNVRLQAPLGKISVVEGEAFIKTKNIPNGISIDTINMQANWPRLSASADFNGQVNFRGAPVRLQGWLETPLDILRGGESAAILQIRSPILNLWSSGRFAGGTRLQYNGSVSATAPSLRKLAETIGYSFSKHGTFANLDVSCDVDFENGDAAFTNLALHLDGNDYEGNLEIRDVAHTPHFSGTLASDFLDVTPFLIGQPDTALPDGLGDGTPFDLGPLNLADLDLRVSAARLRLYDLEVENAALSLLTKPGLIDLALAEATSNNGLIKGRFALSEKDQIFSLHVSGSGNGVDVQPMVFGGQRPLSGSLNALVELDSSGANVDALARSLSGQAAVSANNGTIAGIDLVPTLAGADSRKPGDRIAVVKGTTSVDHLTFDVTLAHGVATFNSGKITGANLQIDTMGTIDVGHRQLDISSLAQITETAGKRAQTSPLWFELKGAWTNPGLYRRAAVDLPLKPAHPNDVLPQMTTSPPPAEE
ncbi:MAG TPA: AsmA family protein [Methylovirgula sp.]